MWSFRIQYHMRFVKHAYFVTLTYGQDQIKRSPKGFLNLHKKDFQDYIKRIRKELKQTSKTPDNDKVKYIVTGEYGGDRGRPHYHAIIFNVDFETIIKHWPHGYVDIKEVNKNRIAYIFKYIWKPRKRKDPDHWDDRVPEYVNFSNGLGVQWLTEKNIQYHRKNIDNPTITLPTGERIAIPRYFKEKIFNEEERQYIADKMREFASVDEKEQILNTLTDDQHNQLLQWKKEKMRISQKKSKKDSLD